MAALLLVLAFARCAGLPEAGPAVGGEIRVERDIAYGEDPRHRLDIYHPPGVAAGAPVVMYFHHGAFYIGNKDEWSNRTFARSLARRGMLVVAPNYRLYPEGRFPAFLEDAAAATAWAWREAARLGGDRRSWSSPAIRPAVTWR